LSTWHRIRDKRIKEAKEKEVMGKGGGIGGRGEELKEEVKEEPELMKVSEGFRAMLEKEANRYDDITTTPHTHYHAD